MNEPPVTTRSRIIAAASELAAEIGPGHLSLEAVAARAGLSKGGLLYNFPNKAKLLEAVVEEHLNEFKARLENEVARRGGSDSALAEAYVALVRSEGAFEKGPPAGLISALAESPDFLTPVRRFNRDIVDRIAKASPDWPLAVIAILTIEGMRLGQLIGTDMLTPDERQRVFDGLEQLLLGRSGG